MENIKSFIFKDIYDSMFEFYINKNKDLIYNKFSEETKILSNVSEFDINITYLGIIEIICITYDGLIKYCKFNKNWSIQTLYKLKSSNTKIKEITLVSIENKLHIFFMFYKNKFDFSAHILHYVWNGTKLKTNLVDSINTIENIEKHYHLDVIDNTINLFYISKENKTNIMNFCKYSNNYWNTPIKLYRLNGSNINFSTIEKDKKFNILNLSKENGIYTLEHVSMSNKNNIQSLPIYKTSSIIYKTTFLIFNNTLYCLWLNQNKLLYSSFNNTIWSNPLEIDTKTFDNINMYKYIYQHTPWDNYLVAKNIFANISSNISIFLPKTIKNYETDGACDAEETIKKLLQEISKKNSLNYNLKNEALLLSKKLDKENCHINTLTKNIDKLSIEKSNTEKKYKLLLTSNNTLKEKFKDYNNIIDKDSEKIKLLEIKIKEEISENQSLNLKIDKKNKELKNLTKTHKNIENQLEKSKNEFNNLLSTNKNLTNNLENKYASEIKNIKLQLDEKENQLIDLINRNENLKNSIKNLQEENNTINNQLEHSKHSILSDLENKYNIETSNIKKELTKKQKSFEYIADYTKELESNIDKLKSENMIIKQKLDKFKGKSFLSRFLGKDSEQ